jgi:hypothetical protein
MSKGVKMYLVYFSDKSSPYLLMDGEELSPVFFECNKCDYVTCKECEYNKHVLTRKHKKCKSGEVLEKKNRKIYHCNLCLITTYKESDYNKHINTSKHKNNEINSDSKDFNKNKCDICDKLYSSQSNLWKHKQKCIIIKNNINEDIKKEITPDLFMEVLKQSKELQNVLIEQNKDLQNKLLEKDNILIEKDNILIEQNNKIIELASKQTTNINSHNNTTNQQFNLQFFLNETCKDAMNLVDFVNSLKLTPEDFETTGRLGFVDGISRIFIKELKKIETEKLPIHCTDLKRETVYIKNNNIWEKENDEKHRLKWTIDRIADLNLNQHHEWQAKYPQCRENNTPENHKFVELTSVALGGRGKEQEDKFREKIMRNVIKEVVLDKKR